MRKLGVVVALLLVILLVPLVAAEKYAWEVGDNIVSLDIRGTSWFEKFLITEPYTLYILNSNVEPGDTLNIRAEGLCNIGSRLLTNVYIEIDGTSVRKDISNAVTSVCQQGYSSYIATYGMTVPSTLSDGTYYAQHCYKFQVMDFACDREPFEVEAQVTQCAADKAIGWKTHQVISHGTQYCYEWWKYVNPPACTPSPYCKSYKTVCDAGYWASGYETAIAPVLTTCTLAPTGCGDGNCAGTENSQNCPTDCGSCGSHTLQSVCEAKGCYWYELNGVTTCRAEPQQPVSDKWEITWKAEKYEGAAGLPQKITVTAKNTGTSIATVHVEAFIVSAKNPSWTGYSIFPMFSTHTIDACCPANNFYDGQDIVANAGETKTIELYPRVPTEDSVDACHDQGSAWSDSCEFYVGVTAVEECYHVNQDRECYYGCDLGDYKTFSVIDCEPTVEPTGDKKSWTMKEYEDKSAATMIQSICKLDSECEDREGYTTICSVNDDLIELAGEEMECKSIGSLFDHDCCKLKDWKGTCFLTPYNGGYGLCLAKGGGFFDDLDFLSEEFYGLPIWAWILIGIAVLFLLSAMGKK